MTVVVVDTPTWAAAKPRLSVLTPFLRDDPRPLLEALETEASNLDGAVELVLLDDGTGDAALTVALGERLKSLALPVRLITLDQNGGRSQGRNRLAQAARAGSLLFLDSDMRPDRPDFLRAWLELVVRDDPPVVFGGFSLDQAPTDRRFAVHRAMATKSECLSADIRSQQPEKYVYTSNLLVRRDVFEGEAFDGAFTGWGWEDVEWAMRVSRRYPVRHIENPATHMGLDTVGSLAGKYEQSAANFGRVIDKHPDIVSTYPSYKAARTLKKVPGLRGVRPLIKAAALLPFLPTGMRGFALRIYRAALYAEAV